MERTIQPVVFSKPLKPSITRVAAYARVSSGKDAMLHSLAAQVSYYNAMIQTHTNWLFVGVYSDEGKTGTKENRSGFQQLLTDCRSRKIDLVITKSISRFARNTVTLLETVRELKSYHIDVLFEEQNIHTLSAEGEVLLTILASFAQEESRSTSENQKWRIVRNFQNGIPWNCTMLGYRNLDGVLVVHPEEADVVRRIFHDYLSGMGATRIANSLNAEGVKTRLGNNWSYSKVWKILRNEAYTGNLKLQKTYRENYLSKVARKNEGQLPMYVAENTHEAIISQDIFDRVQVEIKRRSANTKRSAPVIVPQYSGHIICGICGKHYRRIATRTGHKWRCSTYNDVGKAACASKTVPESVLDELTEGIAFDTITVLPTGALEITCGEETHHKTWEYPSRSASWTAEKREEARQKTIERGRASCKKER